MFVYILVCICVCVQHNMCINVCVYGKHMIIFNFYFIVVHNLGVWILFDYLLLFISRIKRPVCFLMDIHNSELTP